MAEAPPTTSGACFGLSRFALSTPNAAERVDLASRQRPMTISHPPASPAAGVVAPAPRPELPPPPPTVGAAGPSPAPAGGGAPTPATGPAAGRTAADVGLSPEYEALGAQRQGLAPRVTPEAPQQRAPGEPRSAPTAGRGGAASASGAGGAFKCTHPECNMVRPRGPASAHPHPICPRRLSVCRWSF